MYGAESDVVFKFLVGNGSILKIGEKRGTRYYLKDQNIDELLKQKEIEQQTAVTEVEEAPKRREKMSDDDINERLRTAQAFVCEFGKDDKLFSFDELTAQESEFPAHVLRSAIHELLDAEKLFETSGKRGKRYSFNESKTDEVDDTRQGTEVSEIAQTVFAEIQKQKQGVTVSGLVEAFPDLKRYNIYIALQNLEDDGKIERFGSSRATTYSLTGLGSIEKIGSFTVDEVNAAKTRAYSMLIDKRVARPLILQTELNIDRKLLDTALDSLVEEGQLKYDGERRAKVVAVLSADEAEIAKAREEQVSLLSEVCDKLSAIVCSGYSFAAVQKEGKITARRSPSFDPSNKTILHESNKYGDFLNFMKELVNATDGELDEDARNEHDDVRGD